MRFRLYPTAAQETTLLAHAAQARFVWNLALEQRNYGRPGAWGPGFAEQSRQLTEARAAFPWLGAGSRGIQEQALRDLERAMRGWRRGTHGRPGWRKARIHEAFYVASSYAAIVQGGRWGQILIPQLGWVRFRQSAAIDAKSYRVKRDAAGRWWVAFPQIPDPVPGPGDGSMVGLDRGVAISLAASDGRIFKAPAVAPTQAERRLRLERQLARRQRGSGRRQRSRVALARCRAREADQRKDWVEKTTTELARTADVLVVEDLNVRGMTKRGRGKRGLNRVILHQGWGHVVRRLEDKAPGRVFKVPAAFSSQTCSACGHTAAESRESQARFVCVACGFEGNADLNAALVIAGRHPVTARGEVAGRGSSVKREPRLGLPISKRAESSGSRR